jgi:MFS family permease
MFQGLRNRNVGLLFGAQVVSIAGDLVLFVALPFWIFQLTGSAMATGFMFVALTIPQLVFSPIAGVFVDRLDRKRLMIASDLIRAALVCCYLFVNSADQVWMIYLIAFAESSVSQFFRPSVMAVVPTLVEDEQELTRANAALGASWAIGQLSGPALGGLLVVSLGPHAAALVDAGTYLVSAAFVVMMSIPHRTAAVERLRDMSHAIAEITRELVQGIRVVLDRSLLRVVFASLAFLSLANGITNVLLVVIINQLWHVGATEFGWVVSAQGLGGILGSLVVGAIAVRVSPRIMTAGGGLFAGLLFLGMVNQPSVYVAIGLMVVLGMCIVAFDVGLTTLLQVGSDDSNRGRVSGLMQTTMAASQLVSIGLTSLLADGLGALVLLNIAGILFALGGLVGILAPRAHLKPSPVHLVPLSVD